MKKTASMLDLRNRADELNADLKIANGNDVSRVTVEEHKPQTSYQRYEAEAFAPEKFIWEGTDVHSILCVAEDLGASMETPASVRARLLNQMTGLIPCPFGKDCDAGCWND